MHTELLIALDASLNADLAAVLAGLSLSAASFVASSIESKRKEFAEVTQQLEALNRTLIGSGMSPLAISLPSSTIQQESEGSLELLKTARVNFLKAFRWFTGSLVLHLISDKWPGSLDSVRAEFAVGYALNQEVNFPLLKTLEVLTAAGTFSAGLLFLVFGTNALFKLGREAA